MAISSGLRGTLGFRSLVVAPLIAASMITGSEAILRHRRPTVVGHVEVRSSVASFTSTDSLHEPIG